MGKKRPAAGERVGEHRTPQAGPDLPQQPHGPNGPNIGSTTMAGSSG
jgi:hypothetical protein